KDIGFAADIGQSLLNAGRPAHAITWLQTCQSLFPADRTLTLALIDTHIASQGYLQARVAAQTLLERDPKDKEALLKLAQVSILLKDDTAAVTVLRKLTDLDDGSGSTLLTAGKEMLAIGRPHEALTMLTDAAQRRPDDGESWFWLSESAQATGATALSVTAARRAIVTLSTDATDDRATGRMLLKSRGRIRFDTAARSAYAQAEKKDPTAHDLIFDRLDLELEHGRYDLLRKDLAAVSATTAQESPRLRGYAIDIAIYDDDRHKALRLLREQVTQRPDDPATKQRIEDTVSLYRNRIGPIVTLQKIDRDRLLRTGVFYSGHPMSRLQLTVDARTGSYRSILDGRVRHAQASAAYGLTHVSSIRLGAGAANSNARNAVWMRSAFLAKTTAFSLDAGYDHNVLRLDWPLALAKGVLQDTFFVDASGRLGEPITAYLDTRKTRNHLADGLKSDGYALEPSISVRIHTSPLTETGLRGAVSGNDGLGGFLDVIPLPKTSRALSTFIAATGRPKAGLTLGAEAFLGVDSRDSGSGTKTAGLWGVRTRMNLDIDYFEIELSYDYGQEAVGGFLGRSHNAQASIVKWW
ncbi:MAG: tetratricopeptide repeat protein, partial [Elusimicrobiota bacterium]